MSFALMDIVYSYSAFVFEYIVHYSTLGQVCKNDTEN